MFWLEYAAGVYIRITGDVLPRGERVLFICNHVNVEWMHIICLANKVSNAGAFKTIMKESLKCNLIALDLIGIFLASSPAPPHSCIIARR